MKEPQKQTDINLLTPQMKDKVCVFQAIAKVYGLGIFITETKRTVERQKYLFSI